MASNTVRLHRVLTAPPERIYRAFIDPDAMAKWLPPHGFTGHVHEMNAKVGGRYKMSFTNFSNGQSHSFGGEFLELVPGERIVHTDSFDDPNLRGTMKTTITFKKVMVGTEVNVVQEDIPAAIPQPGRVLDFFHHRIGPRLAHAGQLPQHRAGEVPVRVHVGHARLQQVVEAAGHHVALHDLRMHQHRGLELLEDIGRRAVQHHFDEHQQARAQQRRIELGLVAEDVALAREALHARQHRGGRQRHRLGQLQVGDAAVFLQHLQDDSAGSRLSPG
jgi:uncharacterized protein YndB with AHSA1/START domain